MDLLDAFTRNLPIASASYELHYDPERVDEDTGEIFGGIHGSGGDTRFASYRWTAWDDRDGERTVHASGSERANVVYSRHVDDPRVAAYLEGWFAALRHLFARHAELHAAGALSSELRARLLDATPVDLACPELLDLRRPQTAEEFTEALLTSKKRLGRFLP